MNESVYTALPEQLNVGDHMTIWSPRDGFIRQQLWPRHCVRRTEGACLWPTLDRPLTAVYVYKGTEHDIESYSVFGNHARDYDTDLHHVLRHFGITHIYFTGIAEDICVGYSALDALRLGYDVTVFEDAPRGVDEMRCAVMKNLICARRGHYCHSENVL